MPGMSQSRATLAADFAPVQAHYDLSDDFFKLFLDPSMMYSCAKFDTEQTSLADAQKAKIDLSLSKLDLRPGHKLLDVGCGWGGTAMRAREKYGVDVTGLTLSENQHGHCTKLAAGQKGMEFRLEGWETFEGKADRIVSIGAFEHFGRDKHAAFFERCRGFLPDDGLMLLHTITLGKPSKSFSFLRFVHFMSYKIFPGGDVPPPERVFEMARAGGFELIHLESLRLHYARTLDCWADNLRASEAKAIEVAGGETYKTYMKYLTDCAKFFRSGEVNVYQYRLRVA
jgi:cyclopropane-fatty-acyl-phospholipid synthase